MVSEVCERVWDCEFYKVYVSKFYFLKFMTMMLVMMMVNS